MFCAIINITRQVTQVRHESDLGERYIRERKEDENREEKEGNGGRG